MRKPYHGQREFAESDWLRYWAVGRQLLGLTSEEFWSLTPVEFDALLEAQRDEQRFWNFRAGLPAAAIYNCSPRKKGDRKIWQPLDFFGDRQRKEGLSNYHLDRALTWLSKHAKTQNS